MVQDSVSSIPFFPEVSSLKSKKPSERAQGEESYDATLSKAMGQNSNKPQNPTKMDKPKVGNREPFFPTTPMPYHPEPMASSNSRSEAPSVAISEPREEINESDDVMNSPAASFSNPSSSPVKVHEEESDQDSVKSLPDDSKGVMKQSYDRAVVSYPVGRIARESVDKETQKSLEDQGLWNMPTYVMAQPTEKFALMSHVAKTEPGRSIVPVQKPIAQFMASLENELGVSPDRLVQALRELSPGQMAMPPQQTMIQVIKNLKLGSADETKAMELYSKMLAQMEMIDNKGLSPTPLMAGGMAAQKAETQVEPKDVAARYAAQNRDDVKGHWEKAPVMMKPESKTGLVDGNQKMAEAPVADMPVSTGAVKGFERYESQGQNAGMENQAQGQSQNQGQSSSQFMPTPKGMNESFPVKDEVKLQTKQELKSDLAVKNSHWQGQNQFASADVKDLHGGPVQAGAVAAPGAEVSLHSGAEAKHEAIKSIINHAQLLAQKGGGEMHMTLKPDHLGEIQLKVALEGNRVDVQMTAEKSEVKKLIEQNVHELRNGLAQHNLSMEKLDVSVSDRNSGGFNQGRPDFSAARDFANQFHHQQQARREMLEPSGFGSMGRPAASKGAPVERGAVRRGVSSGRLNVVA